VSDNNPASWPQKFFNACLLILLGFIALAVAVHFIELIWPWLLSAALLAAGVFIAVWLIRSRGQRW